ncbi:13E12 repeat family protein [Microbacterium elymi]|uniref:13E12 repeat family protein n=1 Tax=Microbacterium elymi TaxID=2909587 RepID=A0ABY5NJC0_9MICO|nr:13E12 repeat family protein [Microbacterium elymi]UUT35256.1 13E12 repeat family protein [Microbacterium elymi]
MAIPEESTPAVRPARREVDPAAEADRAARDREVFEDGRLPSPRGVWGTLDAIVTDLVDTRRQIAILQAREAGLLSDAVDVVIERERDRFRRDLPVSHKLPLREISAELGAATRLSDRSVQTRMGTAALLVGKFPATYAALGRGEIDCAHASTIVDEGAFITDPGRRAEYEGRALAAAAGETPYRLSQIAKILAARIDPDAAAQHVEEARQDRFVRYVDLGHGRGQVLFEGPAVLARAVYDRITSQAYQVKKCRRRNDEQRPDESLSGADATDVNGPAEGSPVDGEEPFTLITGPSGGADGDDAEDDGDPRTMDQLRADLFTDILLTGTPTGHGDGLERIDAKVQITVPALTLLGHGRQPPILAGHGPIDLATAKRLAANAPGWDRVLTHPTSGEPVAVDRYRPSAELRRFLDVRDEHCRFPGSHPPTLAL